MCACYCVSVCMFVCECECLCVNVFVSVYMFVYVCFSECGYMGRLSKLLVSALLSKHTKLVHLRREKNVT